MSKYVYTCQKVKPGFAAGMSRSQPLNDQALEIVARRFAVLAEPMRLRLIQALLAGEKNVGELTRQTGGTQANISRHLQTLIAAHVLDRRKEGLQVFYRIADPTIPKLCDLVCGSLEKSLKKQAGHLSPGR